jgi:hypothetical protein
MKNRKSKHFNKKRSNKKTKKRQHNKQWGKQKHNGGFWPFSDDSSTATATATTTTTSSTAELKAASQKHDIDSQSSSTNLSLYQIAKEKNAAATTSAAVLSGVTLAGYGIITGLSATGVGLPLAGALAGVLLLSNKMASLYINNQKTKAVMYDVMNIISNCYRMNDVINKTMGIFTIYIYNQEGFATIITPFNDENQYKTLLEKALTEKAQSLGLIKQSGGGYKEEFKTNIVGKCNMNEDIKERIREKIEDLTNLLLLNATDRILSILQRDPDVITSGFGDAVKKELDRRNQSMSKTLGKIKRGFDRTINSSSIQNDILKDLTIINGFFNILKSQYDMTLELYEREFGEDWNKIWGIIQSTNEYINYMEPKDVRVASEEITKNEDTMAVAASMVSIDIENATETEQSQEQQPQPQPQQQDTNSKPSAII